MVPPDRLALVALAWVLDSAWCLAGGALRARVPALRLRVLDRVSAGVYAALAGVTLAGVTLAPRPAAA